ncbi:MAG: hypothetical protein KDC92_09495 [Bacteroidetes bacterium]|nr:hypothetical protein [Streptococcus sp.]MCB0737734.1 hypothetical protein [Bacteroidota bacterium]
MITKKAISKIHLKVLSEKVAPILNELGFKFLKSNASFVKSGNEIDIVVKSFINSSSLIIDEDDNLTFLITLRSQPKLTKFSKWHEVNLGTDSRDLTNSINAQSLFAFEISNFEFSKEDFYEPTANQRFKNYISRSLSTKPKDSKDEVQLGEFIISEVLPLYQNIDNLEKLLANGRIPLYMKPKLLAYNGNIESSKSEYKLVYGKIQEDLQNEERESIRKHFEYELSKMKTDYRNLFNEEINCD